MTAETPGGGGLTEAPDLTLLLRRAAREYLEISDGEYWPSGIADAQAAAVRAHLAPLYALVGEWECSSPETCGAEGNCRAPKNPGAVLRAALAAAAGGDGDACRAWGGCTLPSGHMGTTENVRHTFVNESGVEEGTYPTRINSRWEVVSTTVVTDLHFEHVVRRPTSPAVGGDGDGTR